MITTKAISIRESDFPCNKYGHSGLPYCINKTWLVYKDPARFVCSLCSREVSNKYLTVYMRRTINVVSTRLVKILTI